MSEDEAAAIREDVLARMANPVVDVLIPAPEEEESEVVMLPEDELEEEPEPPPRPIGPIPIMMPVNRRR